MANILIVEDEPKMLRLLELKLSEEGWTIFSAGDAESGLKILSVEAIDLVLSDIKLPGMSGIEFLQAIRRVHADTPVVLMTAYGSVEKAVDAMKSGANDYVLKPFSLDEIALVVRKELDVRTLRTENRTLREELGHRYAYPNIFYFTGFRGLHASLWAAVRGLLESQAKRRFGRPKLLRISAKTELLGFLGSFRKLAYGLLNLY